MKKTRCRSVLAAALMRADPAFGAVRQPGNVTAVHEPQQDR